MNCRGTLLHLERPIVMGIINVTPDSFYAASRYDQPDDLLSKAEQMVSDGVTILDIGGMSSRPGAKVIDLHVEEKRVLPAVELIRKEFPDLLISIDTVQSDVAKGALDRGAHIVNDISAGRIDPAIWQIALEARAPYVLMHMKEIPETMQDDPHYEDVVIDVLDFLIEKAGKLVELGMVDIIVDPGFGFGKTVTDNFKLMTDLHVFKILEKPIMVGLSRKSFVTRSLDTSSKAKDALTGTTALHMVALQQGAKILRAHDVKEAMQCIDLWTMLQQ